MDGAIAAYTKAIESLPRKDHPKASTFYSNRAACYKNLSDFKNVVNDCTASLEVDPNNWKARLRRGCVLPVSNCCSLSWLPCRLWRRLTSCVVTLLVALFCCFVCDYL